MACIVKRRNRWVIDFYDHQGKRRWKTMPKGCTKKKAHEALRDIEDQVKRGVYLPDRKVPLFTGVASDWLEHKKVSVRDSTLRKYAGHLKKHFPEFLNIPISRITTAMVEKYIVARQEDRMNLTTLRKLIVTLNQVMKYAVRHGYIAHNPVTDAERPRERADLDQGAETEGLQVLTPDEIAALLDAEQDPKYRMLYLLAVMSGARQGELFGLKWSDVDWDKRQMHIQRTFNEGAWRKPKSKASNRKIDLGQETMRQLRRWRIACPANDLDLVFPNEAGGPLNHANLLSRHYWPALKSAGIRKIRFHDLRHTKASLMIEQGENIKYIQAQLGHASPVVTLTVYAHLMEDQNPEAADRFENAVFKTTGSKMVAKTKKGATE